MMKMMLMKKTNMMMITINLISHYDMMKTTKMPKMPKKKMMIMLMIMIMR